MSTLYEQLADSLAQRIRDGGLQAGERLPSVRQACAQAQVSPATVFQAYDLLESRGLIEARPRSGFYVRKQARGKAPPAQAEPARADSTEVAISELVFAALQALERLHLRAVEVPTHPQLGVDPDGLAEVIARHGVAACWLMPGFQNPLGALMPNARKQAVMRVLTQAGVPVVEDDVYGELHHGSARPLPLKALDRESLVLHCSSFSKCLAPGYRVGWALPGRHSHAVHKLKMMSSLATSVPSQLALAEYLEEGGYDRHLRQLRLTLANSLAQLRQLVLRHFPAGTRVSQPEGGYFLWVQCPEQVDTLALHHQALAHGISIAPGALFSADQRFRSAMRLNGGHPHDARIAQAVRWLGDRARSAMAG